MDRCTQKLSDSCASTLIGFARTSKISSLDVLGFKSSLKYSIINDPCISVDILSGSDFEIYQMAGGVVLPDRPAIADAQLSDFLLGANRVKKQYQSVLSLKSSETSSAWLIVSAYYCAFFSSIELCKIFNRISLGFDDNEIADLKHKSSGPGFTDFFQGKNRNFIGREVAGKIKFQSIGDKPHSVAWSNLAVIIRDFFKTTRWPEVEKYINLLTDKDLSPSGIRNTWNYKRSDFFGDLGEIKASDFKKLIGNPSGAIGWMSSHRGRIPPQDPVIVAFLCEMLSSAVISAADRLENTIKSSYN